MAQVTDHPVQLIFKNVQPGFRLTAETRASIISYTKELIGDNLSRLDDTLELIDVADAGDLKSSARAGVLRCPLKVTVRGPSKNSERTSEIVKRIIIEFDLDFKDHLISLDDAFKDASISVEKYDFDSLEAAPLFGHFEMTTTTHYVKLTFLNTPDEFSLSDFHQASAVRFIKSLLDDHLDSSLETIEVAVADASHLAPKSLTLRIVIGSYAHDADLSLAVIVHVFRNHKR